MNSKQLVEFYAWMRHVGEIEFDSREDAAKHWLENLAPSKMRQMMNDRIQTQTKTLGPAGDPTLSCELLQGAFKNGEFFYLLWTPDGEGGAFFDMQLAGGHRFADVLAGYALDLNQPDVVEKFMRVIETQFARARRHIKKEITKRSNLN